MSKRLSRLFLLPALFIYVCVSMSSCLTLKDIKLFQDIPDSTKIANITLPQFTSPMIHIDDVISITIFTAEVGAATNINLVNALAPSTPVGGSGTSGGGSGTGDGGYLVDKQGNIEMPVIGKIYVAGLTIVQAQELVRKRASEYFKDPLVVVKSKNLRFTIFGEVQKPGTYNVTNEKVTIMDILSYSGDFTVYGRRDNVLLLRHTDVNTIKPVRLNLKSANIFKSPYYYLQDNDVLYVEPTQGKVATSDAVFSRNLSYLTIVLTLLTTFLVLVRQ